MLVLNDVRRAFGGVQAVDGVSLTIQRGATFGLLGPNGAGKTTTMRMILGILMPDSGSITWDGQPIDAKVRRRFGYLPEERGLYGKMKVRDQIVYFGRLHGVDEREARRRAGIWIDQLGLGEYAGRACSELSKGNQQKVQVACSALHEPEFLILDEPFSGLDPVNAETLMNVLRDLQSRGTTLVLSSHQMWQIEHLCTAFCIIAKGSVRALGSLKSLRSAWPMRVVEVEPPAAEFAPVFAAMSGASPHAQTNGTLAYDVPVDTNLPALLRSLVAVGDVTRFEQMEPSLQEIYLRAIGAGV